MKKSALVLGGGFAGLSAAIHLAVEGYGVTLLEAAPTLGGKAGEVRAQGFRFDTGPSVFTLPDVLKSVFTTAGETLPLTLNPLEPLTRYQFASGRVWDVYRDRARTVAGLSSVEGDAYSRGLEAARKLYTASAPTFVFGTAPGPLDLLRYGLRHGLAAYPGKTLPGLLDSLDITGDLATFFLRFATYFGADPYRAPAVLHNIAWVELGLGVFYPQGGIYAVVRALADLAARFGVEVRTGVQVEGLEVQGDRVRTVQTKAGEFSADVVVSSLDVLQTYRLLGRRTRLERAAPSLSGFVLLLGLAGVTPGLEHHTVLFSADYPAEFAAIRAGRLPDDPTLYLNVSCKTDPSDAPGASENWFVMANAPALRAGADLDEVAYAERVLDVLAARGFDVRERIRFQNGLGPGHLAQFATGGSIYGHAPPGLLGTLRPGQRVPGLQNLALAGGTVYPGGGVPLALLSGRAAARVFSIK